MITRCNLRVRWEVQSGNQASHLLFRRRHCLRVIRALDLGDSSLVKTRSPDLQTQSELDLRAWLPDGFNGILVVCVWPFGLLDYGTAMLCCKIWSLPFLGLHPPCPPRWRNPRKGRDQILPSGNLAWEPRWRYGRRFGCAIRPPSFWEG